MRCKQITICVILIHPVAQHYFTELYVSMSRYHKNRSSEECHCNNILRDFAEPRVQSQATSCRIRGRRSGNGRGFLLVLSVPPTPPPPANQPIIASYSSMPTPWSARQPSPASALPRPRSWGLRLHFRPGTGYRVSKLVCINILSRKNYEATLYTILAGRREISMVSWNW
jgi:hypothetical protein